MKLKKGDIVGRLSYNKDIIFVISDIIGYKNQKIAILKGLITRIEADSPVEDLELIEEDRVVDLLKKFEKDLENRKLKFSKSEIEYSQRKFYGSYGSILHLDGDKKYSEKSQRFYRSMGLEVVVKNIPEKRQPQMIWGLLSKYTPDILVVTGHDGMIKKGHNYNDIYNYRNSRYFVETVMRARAWERGLNKMTIFAGACQSYYEAIMEAGANFASSPARILIDFKDPLIVAEKIAITPENKYVTINDIKDELRDGANRSRWSGLKRKEENIRKLDQLLKCNKNVIIVTLVTQSLLQSQL